MNINASQVNVDHARHLERREFVLVERIDDLQRISHDGIQTPEDERLVKWLCAHLFFEACFLKAKEKLRDDNCGAIGA